MSQPPKELIDEIELYLATSGMNPSRFGLAAVNDPKLVFDLRAGREPRRATCDRIRAFMRGSGSHDAVVSALSDVAQPAAGSA